MLRVAAPDHEVFQFGYVPPRRRQQAEGVQGIVQDEDNFLQNLPDLTAKEMRQRATFSLLSKEDKLKAEI